MSLTEDMALLVSRTDALLTTFDSKAASINAAVAAALAATADVQRIVHVDPVAGNDANVGGLDTPVMTLSRALVMVTNVRVGIIRLLGDVALDTRHVMTGGNISIAGIKRDGASSTGISGAVRKVSVASGSTTVWGASFCPGIYQIGDGSISLESIEMILPNPSAAITHKTVFIFGGRGSLVLLDSQIKVPLATATGRLLVAFSGWRVDLTAYGTTFGTDVAGKVIADVAAGTDPNTIWAYRSNLTSV